MKIFFITRDYSDLADKKSVALFKVKKALLKFDGIEESKIPECSDVFLIQEEISYKNFRYIHNLLNDPLISKNLSRVFTINFDDCANGLLKGLYANIPKSKLKSNLYVAVPYMLYHNEFVFSDNDKQTTPEYLAAWRGNVISNKVRMRIIRVLSNRADIFLEQTKSWLNHSTEEKKKYIELILNAEFSLCPAGWASSSYRIYESMALGRCPVIIADDYSPPLGPDWNAFAFFYPENKIKKLYSYLFQHRKYSAAMGQKAKTAWNDYFDQSKLPEYYANSLLGLFNRSTNLSNDQEIERWNTWHFYWSNNWTIIQRVIIRIKIFIKLK